MKLAIGSDLHLEFGDINLRNEGVEVLILAGDILNADDLHNHSREKIEGLAGLHGGLTALGGRQVEAKRYRDFFDRVSREFPHTVVVAGNHEFYGGRWIQNIDDLRSEYAYYPNVHFLERDMITLGDVVFVGGTLWTDCNKGDPLTGHALYGMMKDFTVIRHDGLGYTKLRPAHTVERHRQTLGYFQTVLDDHKDEKCVVVGHHLPSDLSVPPWFKDRYLMNGGYRSDLSEFILDRPQIKLWVHGHTHDSCDYLMGDTRIVCNPRGYYGFESSASNFRLVYVDV
jgi:Icc-related predicted phosphoesterase